MTQPSQKQTDFNHPSFWFLVEDKIKNLIGCLYYSEDIRRLKLKGEETVLDFGCGGGVAARCLLRQLNRNGYVLGVDTSEYWGKIAAMRLRKYPNAEVRSGDIRTLNLMPKSFDLIVVFHVLHDIATEDRQGYLMTLSHLLKNKGRLFLREPVRSAHGIPVREIRSLLLQSGFSESNYIEDKSDYRGTWNLGI